MTTELFKMTATQVILGTLIASVFLPGTLQSPLNVVFQPYTYQLTSPGRADPDLSPVSPDSIPETSTRTEDPSNHLICKRIQHGGAFLRVSPSTLSKQLFWVPYPEAEPTWSEASRYYVAMPSENLYSGPPEGAFSPPAPAPLVAALCVTTDSPRPFPVLFAPPAPSSNDLRNEFATNSPSQGENDDSIFKVALRVPLGEEVTLGLNGIPVTIENNPVNGESLAGNVVVKLHNVTPGGVIVDSPTVKTMSTTPQVHDVLHNIYRGEGLTSSLSPSVSFRKPLGFIIPPNVPLISLTNRMP